MSSNLCVLRLGDKSLTCAVYNSTLPSSQPALQPSNPWLATRSSFQAQTNITLATMGKTLEPQHHDELETQRTPRMSGSSRTMHSRAQTIPIIPRMSVETHLCGIRLVVNDLVARRSYYRVETSMGYEKRLRSLCKDRLGIYNTPCTDLYNRKRLNNRVRAGRSDS